LILPFHIASAPVWIQVPCRNQTWHCKQVSQLPGVHMYVCMCTHVQLKYMYIKWKEVLNTVPGTSPAAWARWVFTQQLHFQPTAADPRWSDIWDRAAGRVEGVGERRGLWTASSPHPDGTVHQITWDTLLPSICLPGLQRPYSIDLLEICFFRHGFYPKQEYNMGFSIIWNALS